MQLLVPLVDAAEKAAAGGPLVAVLASIITAVVALLAWVVRLILTGRLVPGSERDYWREAFAEEQRQKRELMVTGQVVRSVVRALPDASNSPRAEAPPGGDTS